MNENKISRPNIELGKRVAIYRKEKGYTQAKLAELVDCCNNYISHIETGRQTPTLNLIRDIAYHLDITPDALLLGTEHHKRRYCDKFQEKIELLTDDQLAFVLEIMELMVYKNIRSNRYKKEPI